MVAIRFYRPLLLCVYSLAVLASCAAAQRPKPDLSAGGAIYEKHCARCHGISGKGDGQDAGRLHPKPRDLTSGVFKFRSTASGTSPTDEDLFQTITHGLPGSGMPDWAHLSEALRWQLVYYLKTLSLSFKATLPQPISVGDDPGIRRVDQALGKGLYQKLGCAACHGATGRANGPSAPTLVDNWGMGVRPADLTQGWNYRGGNDPRAIALRVLTGIDGSPMPSYAEAVSTEEAWQLAYYVRTFQQEPRWAAVVRVPYVRGGLPDSSDDPRWNAAERSDVRLRYVVGVDGQINAPQTVATVSLKAVYNDEAARFLVQWHDPTEDRNEPSDALALVLRPVGAAGDNVTLQTWPLRDSPALDLCLWSADRLEAHEALSDRYEPLLHRTIQTPPLASNATYEDGQWSLTLTRALIPQSLDGAARLASRRFAPIAFAVWDGANPGKPAVSPWLDLLLQEPIVQAKKGRGVVLAWVITGLVLTVGLIFAFKRI